MGHGSIVSVLFNVKKRFYTEEITLSRKSLQNSFDSGKEHILFTVL